MKILLIAIPLLLSQLVAFQAPEGTAAGCDNYRNTVHKCACAKAMMCGRNGHGSAEPDAKCKTYCRPEACKCLSPCTSRRPAR